MGQLANIYLYLQSKCENESPPTFHFFKFNFHSTPKKDIHFHVFHSKTKQLKRKALPGVFSCKGIVLWNCQRSRMSSLLHKLPHEKFIRRRAIVVNTTLRPNKCFKISEYKPNSTENLWYLEKSWCLTQTLTPNLKNHSKFGKLTQICSRGVNNKHHAGERWDLEFGFQTPQKNLKTHSAPPHEFWNDHLPVTRALIESYFCDSLGTTWGVL